MTAAFVQDKGGQTGSGTSATAALTGVTAGNHLMGLTVGWNVNADAQLNTPTSVPSATWSSALAEDDFNYQTTNHEAIKINYSENVASGSWTLTTSVVLSASAVDAYLAESSGVKASGSLGAAPTHAHASSSSTAQPGSLTPTAGSILYFVGTDSSGNTAQWTVDNSFVRTGSANPIWNGANQRAGVASKDNVAAAAVNPTFTESSGTAFWVVGLVEFLAAAAATTIPNKTYEYLDAVRRAALA